MPAMEVNRSALHRRKMPARLPQRPGQTNLLLRLVKKKAWQLPPSPFIRARPDVPAQTTEVLGEV